MKDCEQCDHSRPTYDQKLLCLVGVFSRLAPMMREPRGDCGREAKLFSRKEVKDGDAD